MTDSGEGSLGEPLIGLASGWELQAVAEVVVVVVVVAIATALSSVDLESQPSL